MPFYLTTVLSPVIVFNVGICGLQGGVAPDQVSLVVVELIFGPARSGDAGIGA